MLKYRVNHSSTSTGTSSVMAPACNVNIAEKALVYETADSQHESEKQNGDAKEGLKIISEKYDSYGNLSSSSLSKSSSSISSPTRDSVFLFPDPTGSKFREGVTEQDLLQVEMFYKSHKSEVIVCGCLANLYFGSVKSSFSRDQWTFALTGIPYLLLDTGEHHRERKLQIGIAEKGTGFTLWKEVIDSLTSYRAPHDSFHTLHLSTDHTKLAGLSLDDAGSAAEFYSHLCKLTSDPDDILLKIGGGKKNKKDKVKKKKYKAPQKNEISQPCCFVHVTKLEKPQITISSAPDFISAPFNFEYKTAGDEDLSGVLSSMMDSNLTLNSSDSLNSGISDDRQSSETGK
ncbi:hypothetical protein ACJMK2_029163 [Sinanodonta woodiana]|uniref:Uncharacterized protein n=1 Tax=Sinanodonta woodiana TaxID=1069815 RepID=A0ABD3X9B8_SINWO